MLSQRPKKEIISTISHYEKQCNELQGEVNMLRKEINKLTMLPGQVHIDTQINTNLAQIIEHLPIPEYLAPKNNNIKSILAEEITEKILIDLLQQMKELVIETFHFEQERFRAFLSEFDNHVRNFTKYLTSVKETSSQAEKKLHQLEQEVEDSINNIQQSIPEEKTINEMINHIEQHLQAIASSIQLYKKSEQVRLTEYEHGIILLQDKLMQTKRSTTEIRNMLSFDRLAINIDSLTGLPNLNSYHEHVLSAYHRWQRGFGDLSILLIDLDNFKQVNDNYGRLTGDNILKQLAAMLKSSIRAADFIARYGDEEFIIIFERTSLYNATKVAESLRYMIAEADFRYHGSRVYITASFGVASLNHGEDVEQLFLHADKALMQAKQTGRNCVVSA